ncbi:hypothetical protein [Rhizosaccharibacter radicis]|uniref:Uncharacterized protein n=1 Tax=Rhizosaccharibacter radicis TaxID=2782605 RepID=A0ABT1VVU1_9PROT|nr:hypothetical protein [Acetobacteraceae bacterium KSS12]
MDDLENRTLTMGGDLTSCLLDSRGQPVHPDDVRISAELRTRLNRWEDWASQFDDHLPKHRRAPFDLDGFSRAGLAIAPP